MDAEARKLPDFLIPREVCAVVGVSMATLGRMVADGRAPPPWRSSARMRRWLGREVEAWRDAGFPPWAAWLVAKGHADGPTGQAVPPGANKEEDRV